MMKRRIFCQAALSLAAMAATAAIPVVEAPVKAQAPGMGVQRSAAMGVTARENTFFEDFEQRPSAFGNAADNWLPQGWTKFSNAGHTLPTDNTRHNLLWRVTDNDNKNVALVIGYSAYEGNCFAHIISDVAYVTGDGGYHEPEFQDEWLVTPTITPQTEDWLYFKLNYSPAWAVYNNAVSDFSARNNDLDIYASTDDGQTWVKLWNLIDDEVKPNYTEDELRADLINLHRNYVPIYINLKDYVGSNVKIAFRFFGRMGQGMALDNVAVGVPMPVASYTLPGGVFMQQISCNNDFPATPTLLAPYGEEITWRNTSTDILRSEWTYEDETGAKVTSAVKNLVTPAYGFNTTHMTPELMGFFESRESDPYHTNFPQMQAGGFISGYDQSGWNGEFAVGSTDVFDGDIRSFSEYMALNPQIDLAWEKIQGYLDGALDVYGYCSVYAKPTVAYGFDYIDIMARVLEAVPDNDGIEVMVFALDEQTANPTNKIGQAVLWGKDIPADRPDEYINLRFKFDVPVYVEKDIMILFMGCRSGGNVSFPCMLTTHPEKYGNNLVYWIHYDSEVEGGYYDEFKNLGTFPVSGGRHFAGFLMGMGATYSTMERLDNDDFVIPVEGGSKEFKIKSTTTPDRWKLTEDGVYPADWADFTTTYDAATETYTMTVTAQANQGDARDGDLMLICPGSYVTIRTVQPAGITGAFADKEVSVKVSNGDIVVNGGKEVARVYDVAGKLVAEARLDGYTVISGANLAKGAYIVRVDDNVSFKVVK